MLNDSRMNSASTSTYVPPTESYATMHDLNTPPPQRCMDGTRNSIYSYSELGMPTMFATYAQTPPSAQPWLHTNCQTPNFLRGMDLPQQDLVYYVNYPYAEASLSPSHGGHQAAED